MLRTISQTESKDALLRQENAPCFPISSVLLFWMWLFKLTNISASKFAQSQSQKDCEVLLLFQRMFVIYTGDEAINTCDGQCSHRKYLLHKCMTYSGRELIFQTGTQYVIKHRHPDMILFTWFPLP